jgi:flagellar biosynthesis regulator FlbT
MISCDYDSYFIFRIFLVREYYFNCTGKEFALKKINFLISCVKPNISLTELAEFHQSTNSKILQAFLAISQHYPSTHTAIGQFV